MSSAGNPSNMRVCLYIWVSGNIVVEDQVLFANSKVGCNDRLFYRSRQFAIVERVREHAEHALSHDLGRSGWSIAYLRVAPDDKPSASLSGTIKVFLRAVALSRVSV